jgi:hypothetical protein
MEPGQVTTNKANIIAGARLLLIKHNVANFGVHLARDERFKRREQIRLFAQFLQHHPQDRFIAHPTQKKAAPQSKKQFLETLMQFMRKLRVRVKGKF